MHAWSHDDIGMRFFRPPVSLSALGAGAMTMIGGNWQGKQFQRKQEHEQDIDWLAHLAIYLSRTFLAGFLTKRARDRLS